MRADDLLAHADRVLGRVDPVASPRRIRIAAFLIRQALECEVGDRCSGLADGLTHPVRMRTRLLVLRALDQSGAGAAEYAWNALSDACHHHAYELAPTLSQLQHLHAVVADLVDSRAGPRTDGIG